MGVAIVWLQGGDYPGLTTAMGARGLVPWVIAGPVEGPERVDRLPRGAYWMAEPTVAVELLDAARAAAAEVGEPAARILVTAGETRWQMLPGIEE